MCEENLSGSIECFLLYYLNKYKKATECILHGTVCPGSSDPPEKKLLIYLHQKIRFTPFINYYDT